MNEWVDGEWQPGSVPAYGYTSILVVNAGTNLAYPRPNTDNTVLWSFAAGVNTGIEGSSIVNGRTGDLIFVAS